MVDVLCDGSHAKCFSKEDVRTKLAPGRRLISTTKALTHKLRDWYHDCYWSLAGTFDPTTQDGSHSCIL